MVASRKLEATITRIEVIIVESEEDLAELSAGEDIDILPGEECAHCGEDIDDFESGDFEPFVVVIDSDDSFWPLCVECSLPVIDPKVH
jgi:hypothetical protein